MRERWPRTTAQTTALHLVAVWALGALVPPSASGLAGGLMWAGGAVAAGVVAVVSALVMAPALGAIAWGTGSVSMPALGGTWPRRVLWVVLVLAAGWVLWGAGWAMAREAELREAANPLVSGLPFLLVAGLLLRPWRLRLAAAVVLLFVVAGGLVALRDSGPDELTLRLRHAQLDRDLAYTVEIPGYQMESRGFFSPENPYTVPTKRHITIVARSRILPGAGPCGESAADSALSIADCTPEPGGLVYRRGVLEHGYEVRRGGVAVVVSGGHAVDRELLRGAAETVRPATMAELVALGHPSPLFVADIPGFSARPLGTPPGVRYEPTDPRGRPQSVFVWVHAEHAGGQSHCAFTYQCAAEDDGLVYRRLLDDKHGFVARRGAVDVYVTGGLAVDRDVLRAAARQARPATDDELMRTLPAPPGDGNPLRRLRAWLRKV